ncbi:unnamed protein product [Brassica rapa]|uniref:Uncharacterized protein n=1 Tax=Brassica campestris TaxID=3711 RepID=A0A8D9MEQ8_BRACM|nr:unnamed protein product [Brassica rapa]
MLGETEFHQASILGPPPPDLRCVIAATPKVGLTGVRCNSLD